MTAERTMGSQSAPRVTMRRASVGVVEEGTGDKVALERPGGRVR
jgi:hypothetical protein